MTRDSITGVIENPLSQNRYTYAWNNPVNYTDPSGHWPQFLDDAVDSAVNFGKKVVNKAVEIGRSAVNTVTTFFTGSSRSQTSASGARTSSTTATGSGRRKKEVVPTANNAVKKVNSTTSYQTNIKCSATLAVRSPESYLSYQLMRLPVDTGSDFTNTIHQGIRNLGYLLSLIEGDPNDPASYIPAGGLSTKVGKSLKGAIKNTFDDLFKPLKNHSVVKGNKLPTVSKPNSSMDIVDDGNVIRRRFFDKNGNVTKDVDFTNHGNPKLHPEVPHVHEWQWINGKPVQK